MNKADQRDFDSHYEYWDKIKGGAETGYECTAYFRGVDGLGVCDTGCQWWQAAPDECPCAKGSPSWDGKEHYTKGGK